MKRHKSEIQTDLALDVHNKANLKSCIREPYTTMNRFRNLRTMHIERAANDMLCPSRDLHDRRTVLATPSLEMSRIDRQYELT